MRTLLAAIAGCWLAAASAPQGPRPLTIVAFGDSLTAGYGVARSASYPADLSRLIAAAGIAARVVNAGESGDTTTDGRERVPEVLRLHPDWVVLEFGGNDGLRGLPVRTTEANLQAMILELRRAKVKILLVGMSLPPNYGRSYIHSFQAIYPALARRNRLPLLPFLYQDLAPRLRRDPGLLQHDGIHASVAGNRIVAATVWRRLRPLLLRSHHYDPANSRP
jgi:acyl-CoA thioesterase-1